MSGHSKWNNIKNKKGKEDEKRGKVFTKLGRELLMAVKQGGSDVTANVKLKDVISKCRANNMPNENIERIIKRATGEGSSANYEEVTYEGYGPGGVAMIVECTTDNRNRTAGDVRHIFDKFGGNLGTTGCVSYLFDAERAPTYTMKLDDEAKEKMELLIEKLEELDDVSEIYHNYE